MNWIVVVRVVARFLQNVELVLAQSGERLIYDLVVNVRWPHPTDKKQ